MSGELSLVSRRTIAASAERIFDAWTQPEHLKNWWGPRPVTCASANVDLRVGGRYAIVNSLPDGTTLTIEGEFRLIERPGKLVYTWQMHDQGELSLVTVRFKAHGEQTEVIVVHEQIAREAVRVSHEKGWSGCLDALEGYFLHMAR